MALKASCKAPISIGKIDHCKEIPNRGAGATFYPKTGNVYERGVYVGKGILTGGVLEIIKDKLK